MNTESLAALVPVPKQRVRRSGFFRPSPLLLRRLVGVTLTELSAGGEGLPGVTFADPETVPDEAARRQFLRHAESYRLSVRDEGVRIYAGDHRGRLWALRSLEQLLRQAAGETLPQQTIDDRPDVPVRGVLLDISRSRVPRMETLYALIEFWSSLKINQLQLYMEHTFAYRDHSRVWRNASPLSAEEVRHLDGYCADRGIELVPNQNSLGHMERWLRHDEYRHLAECPDGFRGPEGIPWEYGSCLYPDAPESREFMFSLYDELLPNFRSGYVNIGGDEPWELGSGKSKTTVAQRGFAAVYGDFIGAMVQELQRRGKSVQVYGDIIAEHPEILTRIPEDAVILDWGYEAEHPFQRRAARFAGLGRRFLLLPGTSSWNSTGGRLDNALENIAAAARAAAEHGAMGVLTTDWGDFGHTQQLPLSLPPWLYSGAMAWGPEENADLDLADAMSKQLHVGLPAEVAAGVAEGALRLGRLYQREALRLPNATVLGTVLLPALARYYQSAWAKLVGEDFSELVHTAQELENLVTPLCGPAGESDSTARVDKLLPASPGLIELTRGIPGELCLAADISLFSARLAQELFGSGRGHFTGISSSRRQDFRQELAALEGRYREAWLARSRPGGLPESLGHLQALRRRLEAA